MGIKLNKRHKVQCPKCDYFWKTYAKTMYITCPNCQRKFKKEVNKIE